MQFEILPKPPDERAADNPWPQWPKVYKLDYGQEEAAAMFGADPRQYLINTEKFVGDANGNLKEIHTTRIEWAREDGRFVMKKVPGSEKIMPAQLVLLAMGFLGPENQLLEKLGVEIAKLPNGTHNVKAEHGKFQTNLPNVFAAGECDAGRASWFGRSTKGAGAARVCRYLMGETVLP